MKIQIYLTLLLALTVKKELRAEVEFPKPHEVGIVGIQYQGTGCPEGSLAHLLSPDRKALTLLFSDFLLEGEAAPLNAQQKACRVRVQVRVARGWSFGLYSLDYRGYASLTGRSRGGIQVAAGPRQESRPPDFARFQIQAPYADDYHYRYEVPGKEIHWSECALGGLQNLVVHSQIVLQGAGVMTVDSLDGTLQQKFGIVWKRCGKISQSSSNGKNSESSSSLSGVHSR